MSWPQWPTAVQAPLPAVVNPATPVINSAPAVVPPGSQYTPEQWAQLQQQNWNQWAQWQQQYQQWHQQYGAEYQKSINALNAQAVGVPNVAVPPPLPTEVKPPLPLDDPPPNVSYSTVPPVAQPQGYSTAPPSQPSYSTPPANQPSYSTGPAPNQSYSNAPPSQPSNYSTAPPSQHSNYSTAPPNQPPNYSTGPPPQPNYSTGGPQQPNYSTGRPHQSNYSTGPPPRQNQRETGPPSNNFSNQSWPNQNRNQRFNDNFQQNKRGFDQDRNRFEPNKRPMGNRGGWQNQQQQQQPPSQPPPQKHGVKDMNIEELTEAERKFDKQFADWEAQFNKWKEQNVEHPDKEQYREYEKKWEDWRAKLLDRREQMKRKRLSLLAESPNRFRQQNYNQPPPRSGPVNQDAPPRPLLPTPSVSVSQPPPSVPVGQPPPVPVSQPHSSVPVNQPPPSVPVSQPPPNLNDEPLKFKETKPFSEKIVEEDTGDFLKSSSTGGIPGLDLVKDDGKPETEDVVVVEGNKDGDDKEPNVAKKGPDFVAISKGINTILGDQKLLNMLSMVSQNQNAQPTDNLTNTVSSVKETSNPDRPPTYNDQSNLSHEEFSNVSDGFGQRDLVNNFDDQTRSSFTHNEPEARFDQGGNNFGRNQSKFPLNNQNIIKFGNINKGNRFGGPGGDFNNQGGNDFKPDRQLGQRGPNFDRFGPRGGNNEDFDEQYPPGPEPLGDGNQFGGPRGNQDRQFGPRGDMNQDRQFGPRGNMNQGRQFGPRNDLNQDRQFGPRNQGREFDLNQDQQFGPKGEMNQDKPFGPRGDMNQDRPFGPKSDLNQNKQFGPRGDMGQDKFGPKGDMGQDKFSPRGDMGQGKFGPRADMVQDKFGPRGDMGQDKFGPRSDIGQDKFGPRGDMGQDKFGPKGDVGQDKFGPRSGINQERKFGPRGDNQDNEFGPKVGRNQGFGPGGDAGRNQGFGPGGDLGRNQRFGPVGNAGRNQGFGPGGDRNQGFGPGGDTEEFDPMDDTNQDIEFGPRGDQTFGSRGDNNKKGQFGPKGGMNQDRQFEPKSGMNQGRQFGAGSGANQGRQFGPGGGMNQGRQFGPGGGMNQGRQFGAEGDMNKGRQFGSGAGRNQRNQFGPGNDGDDFDDENRESENDGNFNQQFGPGKFGSRGGVGRQMGPRGDGNFNRQFGGDNFNRGQFGPNDDFGHDDNFDADNYEEDYGNHQNEPHEEDQNYDQNEQWGDRESYQEEDFQEPPQTDMDVDKAPPDEPIKPPEADMLKPVTVIDYDHKSLKPVEPEVLIEPIHMFDYRHKPLSRIPLPQRPKWLSETVRHIREFDPPVVRSYEPPNLRRYPPVIDSWRNERPYPEDNWSPHNRRDYSDKPRQFDDRRSFSRQYEDPKPYKDGRHQSFEEPEQDDFGDQNNFDDFGASDSPPFMDEVGSPSKTQNNQQYKEEPNQFGGNDKLNDGNRERNQQRGFEPERTDNGTKFNKSEATPNKATFNKSVVLIDDLINPPGRYNRPPRIVIILRGPPGSGKTFLAKLIKDKEVENGGSPPRILSLDDYFMVEQEKEITEEGKRVKIKEMVYEFEQEMEESYRSSLIKSFKKTITDGYFPFIIVDNINDKVKYFGEMWSFAKQNGFQVYICQLDLDVQTCSKRNVHGRSEADIEKCVAGWEPTPSHHPSLDATSLLQCGSIPDVEMEEVNSPEGNVQEREGSEEEEVTRSKWDNFDCSNDNLAKLDGVNKPLRTSRTMEEYLQLDTEWTPSKSTKPGQKRVRWADLEEQKQQEKMRAIGFVVGQTNWNRMMDPSKGSSALTQTKYIERTARY